MNTDRWPVADGVRSRVSRHKTLTSNAYIETCFLHSEKGLSTHRRRRWSSGGQCISVVKSTLSLTLFRTIFIFYWIRLTRRPPP